ncbi:hypothetical protein [Dactylosporangium sp. CA-233914]|uniref:hypothetical protein n=1 Tax=Dactylosporangium sp. CA-233914 TaxID=3239934 RepID=UPI003D8ACABE
MTHATTWRSGWDVDNPLDIKTELVRKDEGTWEQGPVAGLEYRDLHLAANTDGALVGRHVRYTGKEGDASTDWQFHDADFQWFFVLNGSISVRTEDGQDLVLDKGASAYQPPYWRYQISAVSDDFEGVEVFGPSDYGTVTGKDAPKPERAAEFAHLKGVYTFDRPDAYVRGDGPRRWSLYRDLGTRIPTDGRVHIHIIKLDEIEPSPPGGTGEHHHSMAQFFLPIRGWLDVARPGEPNQRVFAGDLMTLSRGSIHNAFDASPDYMTLEFCVPAEYITVATAAK